MKSAVRRSRRHESSDSTLDKLVRLSQRMSVPALIFALQNLVLGKLFFGSRWLIDRHRREFIPGDVIESVFYFRLP